MEKLYKTPYKKEYSEIYNDIYLLDKTHLQHTQYEINLIEYLCKDKQSWLDIACGTGYHLDNVKSNVEKFGVDRSYDMIAYAKANTASNIKYTTSDINSFVPNVTFNVVTFLWMGYVHQPSLSKVLDTINIASEKTSKDGHFLMTFCDPLYVFENSPDKINKIQYENLIAPNKFKILEMLSDKYINVEELVYPKNNDMYWKKSAFLFKEKI